MGCGERCGGCPLEKIGAGFTAVEVGSRYAQTGLLLVGEASGEAESRDSLPFRSYAQSGSLLSDAMRAVNISREEVAITNLWRCRPPKDWFEGPWMYGATQHCLREYLIPAIEELRPRAILALGGQAFRALTQTIKGKAGTLDYLRGYVLRGSGAAEGVPVIGTYHPAFIRRGAAHLTPLLQRDLRRAFGVATGRLREGEQFSTSPETLGLKYQTAPTIQEAWNYAEEIDPEKPLAFDIETPLSTRSDEDERTSFTDRDIKLFQCTQRRGSGIALPYRDEFIGVIAYILSRVRVKVGFNNWNFDDPVLGANGIDIGLTDDAMVMFNTFQPDLPANLQAAAQFCGFPFHWKEKSESDLAWYGVADVDATLCVYQTMTELLERERLLDAYRHYFRDFHPILRGMATRGIPIDNERREDLRELIAREDLRVTAEVQRLVPAEVLSTKQKSGLKRMPKVTEGLTEIEVTIEKEEKCQCVKKSRAECRVCKGTGIVPVGTVLKRWAEAVEFNPNSALQVKRFMRFMKHPVPKHAKRQDAATGEASDTTEVKELERLAVKTKHPIYNLLIQKRQLSKVEGTYCEGWAPMADGAVHSTFTFNTGIWQLSAKQPNCQNGLKHADPEKYPLKYAMAKAFNGMQRAKEGRVLINFDFKSFFPITMAHDFNMPRYCRLARLDIHSFVTCYFLKMPERVGLWERSDEDMLDLFKRLKKDDHFKFTRDYKSKRVILGMGNGLFYRKMYQVHREDFENETEAKNLYETVSGLFPELKKGQEEVKRKAAEDGRLLNKFGAIRHFYDVTRWDRKQQRWTGGEQAEAAIAFLPASHAFGHARDVMLRLRENGLDDRFGLVNTIHDSLTFHCPKTLAEECLELVKIEMERPSKVLIYPKMAPDGVWVAVEAAMGDSMAEMVTVGH